MKKIFLLLAICLIGLGTLSAQSKSIQKLKDDGQTDQHFYFYPSTLRMMNIPQNEAFNDLVRSIRKLSLYRMNNEIFDTKAFRSTVEILMNDEGYEEYITVDSKDERLYIVGKGNGRDMIVLGKAQGDHFIAELDGELNLMAIYELYQAFNAEEGDMTEAMEMIRKVMGVNGGFEENAEEEDID